MLTRGNFENELARLGLSRYAAGILAVARPGILIDAEPCTAKLPIGSSKMGGNPDLAPDVPWPRWKGAPLSFVAQIRLESLANFECSVELPANGLLSFFCEEESVAWDEDGDWRDGWRVLFQEVDRPLQRHPSPADLHALARFTPQAISYREVLTLPRRTSWSVPDYLLENWSPEFAGFSVDRADIQKLVELYRTEDRAEHQLLGHPVAIDVTVSAPPDHSRLLLQIDSWGPHEGGMMWGDSGLIYYWTTQQALRDRTISDTRFTVECL